jgi:predicted ATPase
MGEMNRSLQLVRDGHGQLIAVVAEAGAGKSRLFYEFKAALPAECRLLEAYPASHTKNSAWLPVLWLPVLELLRLYFGIEDMDEPAARRAKVVMKLSELEPALAEMHSYLFGLLGLVAGADPLAQMDPKIKRRRTLDAIKQIILRESLNQPLTVIFEDLHWIDDESQALLDLLADSIGNSRVLLLVNYRSGYRGDWTKKFCDSQLRLEALGGESAGEMLEELLGEGVELVPLKRLIIDRTEGNPFFIEEMVHALFNDHTLVRNGAVKVARSLSQLRLPLTVQGILAARIDRLASEHKELLQTLSVIGRESQLGLVRRIVSYPEAQLELLLADLQASEFIYAGPALPEVEHVFKHALTQEVAYSSLLIEKRKLLHERVGAALESLYVDRLNDHLTTLAHHYRCTDNANKAAEYLGRAGRQAIERSTYADAIDNLSEAIDLLSMLPDGPRAHSERTALAAIPRPGVNPGKGLGGAASGASIRASEGTL